jgi:hypothetical protein
MLAYYVEFHMRRALAPMLFADHAPEARERASIVAAAEPSAAAVQKRRSRKTSDGLAVMDWSDLIAHLATLTLNEVALPLQSTETFKPNFQSLRFRPQQKARECWSFELVGGFVVLKERKVLQVGT